MKKVEDDIREEQQEEKKHTFKEELFVNNKYSKVSRSMSRNSLWSVQDQTKQNQG